MSSFRVIISSGILVIVVIGACLIVLTILVPCLWLVLFVIFAVCFEGVLF